MRYLYQTLLEALAEHLVKKPDDPQRKLLTMLPLAFIRRGDIATSRRLFQEGARIDSKDAYIWQPWAIMEKEQGNIKEARELFEKGTEADPKNAPLWQAWAELETLCGNIGDINTEFCARWLFKKATDANTNDPLCWTQWAELERKQDNWSQAEQFYLTAARNENNLKSRARIYSDLSSMFGYIGKYEKRHKYLLLSSEANPNDHITQAMLGRSYGFQSEWKKSERHFQLSLNIRPNNLKTQKWYAAMQRDRERYR